MKHAYVSLARAVRAALGWTGLIGWVDCLAARNRTALWLRSWLAVYDLRDLAKLDVPWWTFKAADEVAEFLAKRPDARVLEWGSGASTLWLARRAAQVTAIEHDPGWDSDIAALAPANVRVLVQEPEPTSTPTVPSAKPGFEGLDFSRYVSRIHDVAGPFDLIVIDGRARQAWPGGGTASPCSRRSHRLRQRRSSALPRCDDPGRRPPGRHHPGADPVPALPGHGRHSCGLARHEPNTPGGPWAGVRPRGHVGRGHRPERLQGGDLEGRHKSCPGGGWRPRSCSWWRVLRARPWSGPGRSRAAATRCRSRSRPRSSSWASWGSTCRVRSGRSAPPHSCCAAGACRSPRPWRRRWSSCSCTSPPASRWPVCSSWADRPGCLSGSVFPSRWPGSPR